MNVVFVTMLLLMLLLPVIALNSQVIPEDRMRTEEIIRLNGYPVETHEVLTDDGYYLTMHRIPHGKIYSSKTSRGGKKEVFFVQHGILGSSSNFVSNPPRQCLAFTLADAGYDVWLGNTRGNRYSTKHSFLVVDSDEFWDFSFDEIARYDFPAMVNYALAISKEKQLYYIGHSQGTMIAFAHLSENKLFQNKIKTFFALAPVARLQNIYGPVKIAASLFYGLKWLLDKMHIRQLFHPMYSFKDFATSVCQFDTKLCNIMKQYYETTKLDLNRVPVYLSHVPDGTSIKNLYHYCQLIFSGRFQMYDYGWFGNFVWYFSFKPPVYDLANVRVPIALFSGSKDLLSVQKDVRWISKQLPNVKHNILITGYAHLDFTWSMSAKTKVYDEIVEITQREFQ